jgi:hypothetical protein
MLPRETPLEKTGQGLEKVVMQGTPDTQKKCYQVREAKKQIHHFFLSSFGGHHTLPSKRKL